MKRLLSVCLLMLCLSLPIFGGHTQVGNWCDCGTPGCLCDPGENPGGNRANVPKESKTNDLGAETLLIVAVLLLALRYKA